MEGILENLIEADHRLVLLVQCAFNHNSKGWKIYKDEITELIDEGNIWDDEVAKQVEAESANNNDLEASIMFSKIKQLRDDDTGWRALQAIRDRDFLITNELFNRMTNLEKELIAYQQNRNLFRRFWNPIDLVLNLAQIVVGIVILHHSKWKEDWKLFCWMLVYTCGCILRLPIICYRLCRVTISMNDSGFYMIEKRAEELIFNWGLALFWHFVSNPSFLNDTTQHIRLSWAFFSFIIIRYGFANIIWILNWLPLYLWELFEDYMDDTSPEVQKFLMYVKYAYLFLVLIAWCCSRCQ